MKIIIKYSHLASHPHEPTPRPLLTCNRTVQPTRVDEPFPVEFSRRAHKQHAGLHTTRRSIKTLCDPARPLTRRRPHRVRYDIITNRPSLHGTGTQNIMINDSGLRCGVCV